MDSGERRRQSVVDRRLLSAGIVTTNSPNDYVVALAREFDRALRQSRQSGAVDLPLGLAFSFVTASADRAWPTAGLACRKGCAFCCHQWVSVTAPEAFYLAKRLKPRQVERVVATAVDRREARFTGQGTFRSPCPLLRDDACTAYDARPLVCRMAVSTTLETCRRVYWENADERIPVPPVFSGMRFVVQMALAAALVHSGLATAACELSGAVARASEDPGLERRWLAGEDVFAGLPRDPVDPGANVNIPGVIAAAFR